MKKTGKKPSIFFFPEQNYYFQEHFPLRVINHSCQLWGGRGSHDILYALAIISQIFIVTTKYATYLVSLYLSVSSIEILIYLMTQFEYNLNVLGKN